MNRFHIMLGKPAPEPPQEVVQAITPKVYCMGIDVGIKGTETEITVAHLVLLDGLKLGFDGRVTENDAFVVDAFHKLLPHSLNELQHFISLISQSYNPIFKRADSGLDNIPFFHVTNSWKNRMTTEMNKFNIFDGTREFDTCYTGSINKCSLHLAFSLALEHLEKTCTEDLSGINKYHGPMERYLKSVPIRLCSVDI